MTNALTPLLESLAEVFRIQKWQLVTAESCTGGGVAYTLTEMPGSSDWFYAGFVTYSNEAKQRLLKVSSDLLNEQGAVSQSVAEAMAQGALDKSGGGAQIALAVTGIAGPGGGSIKKPVGTVWIAWASRHAPTRSTCYHFHGDRHAIREQSIHAAFEGLLTYCQF